MSISMIVRLVLCTVSLTLATVGIGQADRPPNVVLIISDDQAWTDYGFMGHDQIKTPCLDRLARQSLTFTRGYVPTSLCRPSLATIITGLYPTQHLITGNDPVIVPNSDPKNRRGQRQQKNQVFVDRMRSLDTIPRMLSQKGYRSFQSGKWWEGSYEVAGFTAGMTHGDPQRGGRHGDAGLDIGRKGLEPIFEFVRDCGDQPFFIWYAPFLPHTPHNPPPRILQLYQEPDRPEKLSRYYAMCTWFDETCGQLVDFVDQQGLGESTLIVYVTDNGWIQRTSRTDVPDHWNRSFAPRSKQSPYEGGIRTPVMLRWTNHIQPQMDRERLVSSVDLAPTILSTADIAANEKMTGQNLLAIQNERTKLNRTVFGEIYSHDMIDLKRPSESLLYRWCVTDRFKLIEFHAGKLGRHGIIHQSMQGNRQPKLFQLEVDPHESSDMAQQNPGVVQRLQESIRSFFDDLPKPE